MRHDTPKSHTQQRKFKTNPIAMSGVLDSPPTGRNRGNGGPAPWMWRAVPGEFSGQRPRRGCLHRLWRVFLVYLLVSIALSLIPERPLSVHVLKEERVDFSGDLLAGAAKRVITPPREMWESLNLYDEKGPIEGVADDIYARSLALGASGSPEVVSVVSMEILVIPPTMLPAVCRGSRDP